MFLICSQILSKNEPRVLVYCYFCQLALLNISLSVETANGSQCNSFAFQQTIANMLTSLINFQQKFALVSRFQHFANKFLNQRDFSHA